MLAVHKEQQRNTAAKKATTRVSHPSLGVSMQPQLHGYSYSAMTQNNKCVLYYAYSVICWCKIAFLLWKESSDSFVQQFFTIV